MSNPNGSMRVRQLSLLLGVLILLAGIGVLIYRVTGSDGQPAQDAPTNTKPDKVTVASPGDVRDRDAWRTTAQLDIKKIADRLEESIKKSELAQKQAADAKAAQEQTEKSNVEIKRALDGTQSELRQLRQSSAVPAIGLSPANGTVPRGVLQQPLPTSLANGRVLNPPGSFVPRPWNGTASVVDGKQGADSSNGSVGTSAKHREIEVTEFEPLEKAEEGSDKGKPNGVVPTSFSTGSNGARQSKAGRGTFIPANTFVQASQLHGVLAPVSGQGQGQAGNPHPLVFEVTDIANLPNLRRLNAVGCRVLTAATGDLSSERVYARLEVLTCVLQNGEAVEMRVKGHVIGDDGSLGIKGTLISKSGMIIAAQIAGEFAKGLGQGFRAFATTQTSTAAGVTQTIDPSRYGYAALGGALAGGAEGVGSYYIKLHNQMFPVVEVHGGRLVELVFTEGVDFPRNLNQLDPAAFTSLQTKASGNEVN
jgi:hypothetical protein